MGIRAEAAQQIDAVRLIASDLARCPTPFSTELLPAHYQTLQGELQPGFVMPLNTSFTELTGELFRNNRLITIGERHDILQTRNAVIQAMPDLYKQGVRTLYLETSTIMQPVIDILQKYPNKNKLRLLAKDALSIRGGFAPNTYINLITAAASNNIRVKAYDVDTDIVALALKRTSVVTDPVNMEVRNRYQVQTIAADVLLQKQQERGLILVGRSHLGQTNISNPAFCSQGIDVTLGAPSISLSDNRERKNAPGVYLVHHTEPTEPFDFRVILFPGLHNPLPEKQKQ